MFFFSHQDCRWAPADLRFSAAELQDKLSLQAEGCLNPAEYYRRKFRGRGSRDRRRGLTFTSRVSPSEAKAGLEGMIAKLNATGNSRAARRKSRTECRQNESAIGVELKHVRLSFFSDAEQNPAEPGWSRERRYQRRGSDSFDGVSVHSHLNVGERKQP